VYIEREEKNMDELTELRKKVEKLEKKLKEKEEKTKLKQRIYELENPEKTKIIRGIKHLGKSIGRATSHLIKEQKKSKTKKNKSDKKQKTKKGKKKNADDKHFDIDDLLEN